MSQSISKSWREITSTSDISRENFPRGIKDFRWTVSGGFSVIPNQSYFRIQYQLSKTDGKQLDAADDVFPAFNMPGNLFNQVFVRMGNQDVSTIQNFCPQVSATKTRLTKSEPWASSAGSAFGQSFSHLERKNRTADINSVSNGAVAGRQDNYVLYQPSCGFFDLAHGLGAGEYSVSLLADQNYKTAAVQSLVGAKASGTDYTFEILDVRFYACMVLNNAPASDIERFQLQEMMAYNKEIEPGQDLQVEFTVPPSTTRIAVFVQDEKVGTSTLLPPSRFNSVDGKANDLESLQLTLGNLTKPTTRWQSRYSIAGGAGTKQEMYQRYTETHLETGLLFSNAGPEKIENWLENGNLYFFSFDKESGDLSSRLQLSAKLGTAYTNPATKTRLFIVCFFSRSLEVTVQNGYISNVRSLTI